jgi:hypothetical protein
MRIDSNGNLGINTTQGISKLQVNNIGSATSYFSVVGGDAIVSGNSVTVSKTQRGILHIENNEIQAVGKNASLTFGLGGSQFVNTYYHISGAIRTETTGSGNLAVNPKMVFSVLNGASTTGTLTDYLEISNAGDIRITDKIVHLGDTNTAIRFPSDDTVTIETGGTEAVRIDSSQNVSVANTSGTLKFNVQNTGIIGGTVRTPNANNTTVTIYTVSCSATTVSTQNTIANGTLKLAIFARTAGNDSYGAYTVPFVIRRGGRNTGSVILALGTPSLVVSSGSAGTVNIDSVAVALSSATNTGANFDVTVTTTGDQAITVLQFNSSVELTQWQQNSSFFTIVPA